MRTLTRIVFLTIAWPIAIIAAPFFIVATCYEWLKKGKV